MPNEDLPFILPPDHEEEPEQSIIFQSEEIDFQLDNEAAVAEWIVSVINMEKCRLTGVNFIFCSDDYLHQINVTYLDHDTLTDIITFPYDDPPVIHGDIFISIDRIRDNATQLKTDFSTELHRVIIHGVLHLCGYGDKTPEEKSRMTQKEDNALQLYDQAS
ncbi:MAG: rRNA maturation RNase YbeY [Saprospiraceae bacterium]